MEPTPPVTPSPPDAPVRPRTPTAEEEALLARHWAWLRARCLRLLARPDSAEAAAAHSLAKLIHEGSGGDERARLLRLSGDWCVERLGGQGRLDAEWKQLLKGAGVADAASALRAQILARLPGLRPADQALVLDHWLDGRGAEEIAGARGLAPAAVARRLERFRAATDERLRREEGTGLMDPAPALDPAALPALDEAARTAALAMLITAVDALPPGPIGGRRGKLRDPGVWGPAVALAAFAGLLLYMLWPAPAAGPRAAPLGPLTTGAELVRYKDGRPDRVLPPEGLPADEPLGFRVTSTDDRLLVVVRLGPTGPAEPVPGLEFWPVRAGQPSLVPPLLEPGERTEERLFFFFCAVPLSSAALLDLVAEAYPPGMDGRRDLGSSNLRDVGECQVRSLYLRRQR